MKKISVFSDLAISGAAPAFAEPLHVGRPNLGSKKKLVSYIDGIFERRWVTNNGPLLVELERRVAEYLGVRHCIAMCNGTVALEIAVRALGLTGEVIVPSYTFIATVHALHWQGITPVFVDIDPQTHTVDPSAVQRLITPRTTGILGVHLWGRGAEVQELQEIADRNGLQLLLDAAHAFGCSVNGTMIGSFGRAEVLSFHATKFFNTLEGGAVVTNDASLAEILRLMRNFGFSGYDTVIYPGINGKMTEVSAAMGLVNLDDLAEVIQANKRNYTTYRACLSGVPGLSLLPFDEDERNNYQYVVLEVDDACPIRRDALVAALHAENILARRYFWPGCHNMAPYKELYPLAGALLPNTTAVGERVVVLPTGKTVTSLEVECTAAVIRTFVKGPR